MRMMSPDGMLGEIPLHEVSDAEAAGFRIMTDQDMCDLFQRSFMTHGLLQEKEKQTARKFARRQSLRKQMMRRGR